MSSDVSGWEVMASIATAGAAAFAGLQIRQSRIDSNRRASFEHLRDVEAKVQQSWAHNREDSQADVLSYFRGQQPDLTPAAKGYLGLINSLDLLALARAKGMVDKGIVDEHVATLVDPSVLPLSFLKELQRACGDDKVYQHIYAFLNERIGDPQRVV